MTLVFRLEETRTVSNDWVVRYHTRCLQLERQSGHPPARSTVRVAEAMDGRIEIRYRDRVMRWTEIVANGVRPPHAGPLPASAAPAPAAPRRRYRPAEDHPWKQDMTTCAKPIWQMFDR